ncbi:leucine-rich repeat-containing protein kinase family protein [Methylobacterium sp. A54F]
MMQAAARDDADAPEELLRRLRRGELAGIRALRLPACGLTEFPPEILGLADTLERLDLAGNALTGLPGEFGRLRRLRVLFGSGNRFARLPPVLGDCPALSQVGFRDTGMREVPAEALPARLRWLTLTGNRIATLPDALGERPQLQKLMLSGNRLDRLPESLADAGRLELLRISANLFDVLPPWLARLPALAWVSWAGNPGEPALPAVAAPTIPWSALTVGAPLGAGASGIVSRAAWTAGAGPARAVALKLFRGAMTSDGLPEGEMAACLAAGDHPNLTGGLGRVADHPEGAQGLLLRLLPDGWSALASPPSLESCSRDVYAPALRLPADVALRIAGAAARAAAHLHGRRLLHGDLYAHNVLWDGTSGEAVLSDFGAACVLPTGEAAALERIEVRAWGLLLGELLDRCEPEPAGIRALRELERACTGPDAGARPRMHEVVRRLGTA